MKNKALSTLFILITVVTIASPVYTQNGVIIDPAMLPGEWWGDWWKNNYAYGKYYMTVKRVDSNKVWGVLELTNTRQNPKEDFEGIIEEDKLFISAKSRSAVLKWNGKMFIGDGHGTTTYEIRNLMKVK